MWHGVVGHLAPEVGFEHEFYLAALIQFEEESWWRASRAGVYVPLRG